MPNDTVNRICNLVPSRGKEVESYSAQRNIALASLPAAVDLREEWWCIGDQEETGSCVGWAIADGVLRYTLVKGGRLEPEKRLSPRFTWMASKERDRFKLLPESFIESAGTSLQDAVDVCKLFGAALEDEVPFRINTTMFSGKAGPLFADARRRSIRNYANARLDFEAWRHALADGKPLAIALEVDHEWRSAARRQGKLDDFQMLSVFGGHAACVVGYRDDGRFIIRNSWGTKWGDMGFAYASERYLSEACYPEAYVLEI